MWPGPLRKKVAHPWLKSFVLDVEILIIWLTLVTIYYYHVMQEIFSLLVQFCAIAMHLLTRSFCYCYLGFCLREQF